jgi:hypothetical protein
MENKWQIGPVKLANGFNAIIHRFCEKRNRYIGEHMGRLGGAYAAEWNIAGEHTILGVGDPLLNLAPPPKKTRRVQAWINIHSDGDIFMHLSQQQSENYLGDMFAVLPIDLEVEEGKGL